MLVLTRKRNEDIVIDDDIVVRVLAISGDKVRLGIEAAREIPVHRGEVQRKRKARLQLERAQQDKAQERQIASPSD